MDCAVPYQRNSRRSLINKKGISPLIATVIIIAITVAAGITLYTIVFPLISNPLGETACEEVSYHLIKVPVMLS